MLPGVFVHVLDTTQHYPDLKNPLAAVAGGGIYHYDDGRDTPDVINLILEYPERLNVTFEGDLLAMYPSAGAEFHGTGGVLTVTRYAGPEQIGYKYIPNNREHAPVLSGPGGTTSPRDHLQNWLECIRTRKKPNCDEVTGYYNAIACFMGNLAYQTRSRVVWQKAWDALA